MNTYLKIGQSIFRSSWFLIFIGLLAAGCASTKQSQALNPPQPAEVNKGKPDDPKSDRFAVGDLVTVTFPEVKGAFSSHQERIKEDGTITLLFIGVVKA